jgi:hypothetical protein
MPNFVETLETELKFRRDFNKVLRFTAGLRQAPDALPVADDNTEYEVQSSAACLIHYLRSFVNTPREVVRAIVATAAEVEWQDTMQFYAELRACTDEQIATKIEDFVSKCIKTVDESRHLTAEQKDLIQDKLFAEPVMLQTYLFVMVLQIAAFITAIYMMVLLFKLQDPGSKDMNVAQAFIMFDGILITGALIFAAGRVAKKMKGDITANPHKFKVWVTELADEIVRLGFPCEPDDSQVAESLGIQYAQAISLGDAPEARQSLRKLRNKVMAAAYCVAALSRDHGADNRDAILRSNATRRQLDNIMQFMAERVASTSFNNAIALYLLIRSSGIHTEVLRMFIDDCKTKLTQPARLLDLEKNALLDSILIHPASRKHNKTRNICLALAVVAQLSVIALMINAASSEYNPDSNQSFARLIAELMLQIIAGVNACIVILIESHKRTPVHQNANLFKTWVADFDATIKKIQNPPMARIMPLLEEDRDLEMPVVSSTTPRKDGYRPVAR